MSTSNLQPVNSSYLCGMNQSSIKIDVLLDPQKVPQEIIGVQQTVLPDIPQKAKAMCIAFWDGADKTALRIDLWTKDMMVDEMTDFFYQMFSTMADTYQRATKQNELSDDIKNLQGNFIKNSKKLKETVNRQ